MVRGEVFNLRAYATAVAGCVLCFLTLGSAVTFLDVATISYLDLPRWSLVAVLAATVGPVAWFSLQLFGMACRFELSADAAASDTIFTESVPPQQV